MKTRVVGFALCCFGVLACSSSDSDLTFLPPSNSAGGAGSGAVGSDAGLIVLSDSGSGFQDSSLPPISNDCSEAAKLIYLVSSEDSGSQGVLYAFNPETPGLAAYKRIGTLKCNSSSSPQSMSVDRTGTAYVFYSDGKLFKVSTQNASCVSTNYLHKGKCDTAGGRTFCVLGMGFTSPEKDSKDELLYTMPENDGLWTVDLTSLVATKRASLNSQAELTGGGDGRLFMFVSTSASIAEINQKTFKTTPVAQLSLSGISAFAFSRYRSNFYVFTASSSGKSSRTTVWDAESGKSSVRDPSVGFKIVGAGQSTCVRQDPPPK